MVTTEDMIEAYMNCRRNKRGTRAAILYEMDYGTRLVALRRRINDRTYSPGVSICFVVTRPRYREVFAADFEDRIIHHYIAARLEPLLERQFSDRTFNCRRGKGQLYGIRTLTEDIRECSDNYTRDCYVARADLQGFFMSIDKRLLCDMVCRFVAERYTGPDIEDLAWLCRVVIMHSPERRCRRHSPAERWSRLAPNKSLFTNGEGLGVAIGNLFAQHFANFLLDGLDHFMSEDLGLRHVGRYVDDFYIIDRDKRRITAAMPRIRAYVRGLRLTLHPKKFYLQHYTKGVPFTGCVVKPGRVYAGRQTVFNFGRSVRRLNAARDIGEIIAAVPSVNSYLGLLRCYDTYAIRRNVLSRIDRRLFRWLYVKGHFDAVCIRKRYRPRAVIARRLANGTYYDN